MPATVHVLLETNDRTGFVIGVFADRGMAIDAARSWAQRRARRCHEMDLKTLGPAGAGTYDVIIDESGDRAHVSVGHCPSGERDDCAWHISPFEIVESPSHAGCEQPELLAKAAQEREAS